MSSFSLETSTPMCTVPDFMLYYPCLEAGPGGLDGSRNAYATVEPLDETRRRAKLTRRIVSWTLLSLAAAGPSGKGLSGRAVLSEHMPGERGIVYQILFRQDPLSLVGRP